MFKHARFAGSDLHPRATTAARAAANVTMRMWIMVLLAVALPLPAPAVPPPAAPPLTPGVNWDRINWDRAPIARIQLISDIFKPGILVLRLGQPVRLIFYNNSGESHDFVTRLFGAVATRLGTRPGGIRIILQAVESAEFDIVPTTPGTYALYSVMMLQPGGLPPAAIIVR